MMVGLDEPGVERELRLALAMRGGVSLAVWIGGACAEIDELRRSDRDDGADPFWAELRRACGFSRVRVDVMSGASAGGLNGVLFAAAIRHGFRMGELLPIWEEVASLSELRRERAPWSSVLDGDTGFLGVIEDRLAALVAGAPGEEEPQPVDLQLSATLVEPIVTAAVSPSDELLTRTRSEGGFHFRHDRTGAAPRTDLDGDVAIRRLAAAARASASFPVAFEGALVRSSRPTSFSDAAPANPAGSPVDCRGVFSEAAGPPRLGGDADPADFVVADGGIIDNIPIGRALDAVAAASADGPTRRVVAYLHPTGPPRPSTDARDAAEDGVAAAERRATKAVLHGMVRARVQGETIDRDIDQLERFNASIRLGQMLRRSTVRFLPSRTGPGGVPEVRPSTSHWQAYVVQRSSADAARLRTLLDDPLAELGEDPFPVDDLGDDVWRAPLARWTRWNRENLDAVLSAVFAEALEATPGVAEPSGAVLRVGLSSLRRSIDLVLEWCRYLPSADPASGDAIGAAKRRLYDLRSSVAVLERIRRQGWIALAGHAVPAEGAVGAWASAAVAAVDDLLLASPGAAAALADPDPSAAPYLVEAEARLDALTASGFVGATPPTGSVDARIGIVDALVALTDALLAMAPAYGAAAGPERVPDGLFPDDHPGALADRVLRSGWGATDARLVVLEVLSLAEHLAGATPTIPIDFYRISAAAPCPLASQFVALQSRSGELGAPEPGPGERAEDLLRPDVKLAGNELANFSAFLDPDWRRNDWMWGRLDATAGLVRLLVDSARVVDDEDGSVTLPAELCALAGVAADATQDDVVRALTARRQDQVATECDVDPSARADYTTGLEDLTHPGSKDIRRTMVRAVGDGAKVLRSSVPGRWRLLVRPVGWIAKVVVWVRTRPTGKLPPPPEPR